MQLLLLGYLIKFLLSLELDNGPGDGGGELEVQPVAAVSSESAGAPGPAAEFLALPKACNY